MQALPKGWQHVNVSKAVLPRLVSLLKHGCYGSGVASYPALLPFAALLPEALTTAHPDIITQILTAVWVGLPMAGGKGGKAAAATSFR